MHKHTPKIIGAIALVVLASLTAFYIKASFTKASAITSDPLTASDYASYDHFGNSVSIDGDYAIVGAPDDYISYYNQGSAYIFKNTGGVWSQIAKLTASDASGTAYFGYSVSISGYYAIVGAYFGSPGVPGSAYIFYKDQGGTDTWGQQAELTASDGVSGDYFGYSVGIDGDTAIVGAINDDTTTYDEGSAYIFVKPGASWINMTQTAKLTASDMAAGDQFGWSASISGDTAIVGSPFDDDMGYASGSAYMFVKPGPGWSNMTQTAKLTASDGTEYDYLGYSVSISGDYAIAGARGGDVAYIFEKPLTGWADMEETVKLDDAEYNDYAGWSVSISGNYALVGATNDGSNGSVYAYQRISSVWSYLGKIVPGDGTGNDFFGSSVSISGNDVLVGSIYHDVLGSNDAGAAYTFDLSAADFGTDLTGEFTDPVFLDCVSSALDTPGSVNSSEAAALTELDCSVNIMVDGIYAENMDGVEYLTSLETLNMNGNKISDISGIKNITTLQLISLANNEITDISSLDDNPGFNPYSLDLSNYPLMGPMMSFLGGSLDGFMQFHNNITDISVLSGMTNLVGLGLIGNSISDVTPLTGLTDLQFLALMNNNITDTTGISALSGLNDIKQLFLGNFDTYVDYYYNFNEISDISVINNANMPDLEVLYLPELNITDVTPLKGLDNLEYLDLSANPIGTFRPIASNNPNLADFCGGPDSLDIVLNENDISNATNYVQAITDLAALDGACNSLTTDFSYENCANGIDDDGDGDTDLNDSYCFASTYYVDSTSGGGAGCGIDADTPCSSLEELFAERESEFIAVLTSPPYEDMELVVKGPIANPVSSFMPPDFIPVMTDGFGCMFLGITCSSNSFTVRSYSDDPADMGWFTAPLVLMGKNITIDGVGIVGNSDMSGILVMGARNVNIKRNAIGWNGFGLLVGAGNGINVENNFFAENIGGIDVDNYFMGLLSLGVVIPSCGGVATAGSKDISIVNNSFYDNCDGFDIVANVFNTPDPDDLIMKVADIGIVSLDFLPVTSVENAIVKQNMVYEDNPGAHGYYYQPSFGSVNGVPIPDYLFDEFAVAIGGGNVNATDDPYVNSACDNPVCFETDFYLATPDDYNTCSIEPETPAEDIFKNKRPDGPMEPGAFESTGGSCGGGGSSASVCPVTPVQIDLPSSVPVSYSDDGKPTVQLSWAQGDVSDLNAEKKIEIFSDFLSKNPDYTIGATEKKLESVFIRYIYDEIKKDEDLTLSLNQKLKDISDKEISGVKNILSLVGLQEIFSDWWPYMALYNLKANTVAGNMFKEAVKDAIKVIEDSRGDLDAITLWRKVGLTMYNTVKSEVNLYATGKVPGFKNMQTVVNCIDDKLDAYQSSGGGGVNVSAFLEGILSGLQQSGKDKINKALDKIKVEGRLEELLSTISFDTDFLGEMKISLNMNSIGFSDLLNVWEGNTAIQQLVGFFQTNENFRYFKQLVLGTALVSDIEACIENNYDRPGLLSLVKTLRLQVIKESIDKDGTCCDGNVNQILSDIIDYLRVNPQSRDTINGFMLGFINDLLQLEDNNKKLGLTGGIDVATPFTDFYNENFGLAREEIVGGLQAELYRSIPHLQKNDELIATVNSSITSYTDENVPENNTDEPKDYNYYLVTKTSCSQAQGRQATAKVNPVVKPGTPIDVTLDLKITVKESFDELFMRRLMKLFKEDQPQASVTADQTVTSAGTQGSLPQPDECAGAGEGFEQERTGAALFYYVIACFGQDNGELKTELAEIRPQIIPPLMIKVGNMTGDVLKQTVSDFLAPVIDTIQERLALAGEIKNGILPTLALNKSDLEGIAGMQDLTNAQKELIKNIDESYFDGASHAADITIEKYDSKGVLIDSYRAHTDVFGETMVNIGKIPSGEPYTIKIRLTDQRFVLPKITLINIKNAAYENGTLKATVELEFDRHFRFGDFNEDDVINLKDLEAWGKLLKGQMDNSGDYKLWQMWEFANLDGLSGINLLDAITFQQNWGEEKKGEADEISLTELANMLGIDPASIILQGSEAVEGLIQGSSQMVKPDWWDLLDKACVAE